MTKSIETYKLGVVLDVQGQKAIAALESADRLLGKVGSAADNVRKGLANAFGDGLRNIGANLANIKAGLDIVRDVGGFVFGLAKDAAEAGSKFHDLSVQTGLSVETLSGLRRTLKQSGTDMDSLARGVVQVQKNLGEMAGGSKEMQRAFAALGIKDARAALADTDGTVRTLIKSLAGIHDAGLRNALGAKLMGRGYKELAVFIAEAGGNLDEIIEKARKSGEVMSDEAADAADVFGDQLDALSDSASVAGRIIGLEAIPQITGAMRDLTSATESNASVLRSWGKELANIIEYGRFIAGAMSEFSLSDDGHSYFAKLDKLYDRLRRERLKGEGKLFDLNAPMTPEQESRGARERARALAMIGVRPAGTGGGDDAIGAGGGGGKSKADSAKKKFVETLYDWAETFGIPRSQLRELGSRAPVHRGWAHKAGMAVDISPQFMTPQAIEGARRMGLNVIPELYTGKGPNGNSTGPHYHIQALTKAAQEANKTLDEQSNILDGLAKSIAGADLELKGITDDSVEHKIALEYERLGIGRLTGEAQELGEQMFATRAEQIKAQDASKKHADALDALKSLVASTTAEVFGAVSAQDQMVAALNRAGVAVGSAQGQWALLLATMKEVGDLTPNLDLLPAPVPLPAGEGPVVGSPTGKATSGDVPPEMKSSRVRQVWKEISSLGDETRRLQFTFQQLAQSLQQQQQVGKKRGFFSKLLGFASPFLSLIPGVGPILALGARVASSALAGDYMGAALGAAGGFAPGGVFRGSPAATLPGGGHGGGEIGVAGKRAMGGPVRRGRAYLVGEMRPEVFTPEEDGWIHPSAESYARGRRGHGPMGTLIARLLDQMDRHASAVEGLNSTISSVPFDHVVRGGARGAAREIFDAHRAHVERDPKSVEWMQRRVA